MSTRRDPACHLLMALIHYLSNVNLILIRNLSESFTMRRLLPLFILSCVMAFTGAGSVHAALPDYSEGMIDRDAALARAATATAKTYPNANLVIVDRIRRTAYEPDGTYEQWSEYYLRVLTEEGRRANTTVSRYFTIPYQRGPEDCRVTVVEIVKPDGESTRIDIEAQSRVMINPGSMSKNIYNPNGKIIRVNVPGLEVGDVLRVVSFSRTVQARMANAWSDWVTFEGAYPILRSVVEIDAPAAAPLKTMALRSAIKGTVSHTIDERDGRVHYRWEARDVPRMFLEPNMPSYHTVVQRLLVSTLPDWETVSRWYWNLSEPHYEPTPEMKEKVAALIDGADTTLEKINAIFRFVSQEIRYMGIPVETTAPGYEPHDVKDTFEARHGVCRDKAALLVVMLRLAGIDAFPTLIHTGPRKDQEVPQPFFNHAIVAAQPQGQDYILMDPTSETTATLLPSRLNFKSFLVARPEGDTLRTSPIDPADVNIQGIETQARVRADGSLSAETVFDFGGYNDHMYRAYFARISPEERRRFAEALVRRRLPGARVTDTVISPTEMLDTSTPLSISVSYEAPDILIRGDQVTMLPPPLFSTHVGKARNILSKAGLRDRRFPLVTDVACGVKERLTVTLDPALGILSSLPSDPPVKRDAFEWGMAYRPTEAGFTVEADLRLNVVEFSPDEYQHLRRGLEQIEAALRKMPILTHEGTEDEGADVLVLSDTRSVTLQTPGAWTDTHDIRQRVLTYAGKKKNSEIKLHYNPAWEEVRVENVVVTSPDGATHTISAKEINIMDAPWAGSAPRYPVGKTLVASLPAVEVGSTLAYRTVRVKRDRPFFASSRAFRSINPVEHIAFELSAPAGTPLHVQADSFKGESSSVPATADAGSRTVMRWSDSNLARVESEDSLPPWWSFNPTVFVSTGNWRDYAGQIDGVLARATRRQRDAERLARKLVAGEKNPWERVRIIRDYVATRVRAAGPALPALPLTAVSPADVVLKDGYGNTTDHAVLLLTMLRAVGFKPEAVLVSGVPDIPELRAVVEAHPDPTTFTTVLVRLGDKSLKLQPGSFVYLNDTDQYAAVGACVHEGMLALRIKDGGIGKVTPCRPSRTERQYKLDVKEDGAVVLSRVISYYGSLFGARNKQYTEMTPEERDRHFQEMVTSVAQSARPVGKLKTDFTGYPGTVSFTVTVPDYAIATGDKLYFELPDSLARLLTPRASQRINPAYRRRPRVQDVAVDIRFPAGYKIAIAPAAWKSQDVGQLDLAIDVSRQEDQALTYTTHAAARPVIMSPSHYQALLDVDKRLSYERARTVVLVKDAPPAEAR